jgi:hypothetical protein
MLRLLLSSLLFAFASAYFPLLDPQTDDMGRGGFEVDLVFPREGTFSPTNSTPIIFALQNPQRAADLGVWIKWYLIQTSNTTRSSKYDPVGLQQEGEILLQSLNKSTISNPYLAWDRMTAIGNIEDVWTFDWTIHWRNCTEFDTNRDTTIEAVEYSQASFTINFTTKGTAPQPASLETALANNTCRVGDFLALNVTMWGFLPGGGKYCSELGDPPTGENRNCFIGDDSKKPVMDEFAYMACMDSSPRANCTKPGQVATDAAAKVPVKHSSAVHGVQVSTFWMLAALVGLGGLLLHY